jgi:small-conductance mechanosensitive channel
MAKTKTTVDNDDAQIAKLEKRMRYLLEKIEETQSILNESNPSSSIEQSTIKRVSNKSRKEIFARYVKERLTSLTKQLHAVTK